MDTIPPYVGDMTDDIIFIHRCFGIEDKLKKLGYESVPDDVHVVTRNYVGVINCFSKKINDTDESRILELSNLRDLGVKFLYAQGMCIQYNAVDVIQDLNKKGLLSGKFEEIHIALRDGKPEWFTTEIK